MLLWLMGLPYCEGYNKFVEKLTEDNYKNILGPTRTSRNDENPLAKELSAVIFQLPTVFYSVEGRISYLNEVFDQFKNDGTLKFDYPTEKDDLLKTLSAYVAVCYPILKYLMQRCDVVGSRSRRPRAIGGRSTTPTDEQNGSWGELLVNGNENSDEKGKKAASGASAPPTALRDYLVFMGFTITSSNSNVTGDDLHDNALKECFSASMKDDEDDDGVGTTAGAPRYKRATLTSKNYQKLPALRKLAKHVLQGLYNPGGVDTTTPSTIRQMMLWLIGLPLTTAYKSSGGTSLVGQQGLVVKEINQNQALMKLEQGQSGRRHSTPAATGKHFKQQLKDSIVGMIMLFQRIEGGLGSVLEFLKEGFKDGGGGSSGTQPFKYKYDKDSDVFNDFKGYVYKVHTQLRFLKVMCKTEKNYGGWQGCQYTTTSSVSQGDSLQCTCLLSQSYTCHGPLRTFLTSNEKNKFQNGDAKMGFKGTYSSSNNKGSHIYDFLKELIEEITTTTTPSPATSKPLSLLTQYCVAIGNMDPSSLGDHFDVFRELANGMWNKIQEKVKDELKQITKDDTDGSQAGNALQGALKAVWPTTHNGDAHGTDLMSITGCSGNTCTPFVASLSYGLYRYVDPMTLNSTLANRMDWLYMKMSGLYGKLTALLEDMREQCKCCQESNPSSAPCQGITQCPNCLPLMYKMGLVFGDPSKFNGKKCSDLMDMMKKVLDSASALCVVFKSIDGTRFWPYLLFSAMVVKEKLTDGKLNGDEVLKSYTLTLGTEYGTYLTGKKKALEGEAEKNLKERKENLACNCQSQPHQYNKPTPGTATATTVTVTLYFQGTNITTITLSAPHHGPAFNPLVRLYPRNLKSIVDWLLRIGQTRLGQEGSGSGIEEMCDTLWPKIQECLNVEDKDVFKKHVEGVMSLMGLENKGKNEVSKEVEKALKEVTEKLNKKLNDGNGEGFQQTFQKILEFSPKEYIDEVFKDFGKQVCTVKEASGSSKQRDFNCVAKSLSTCMSTALEKIKELVKQNKKLEKTYGIQVPDVNNDIQEVSQLKSIENLKQLCDGFKDFHEAYTTVTGAFTTHLTTAQKNGGNAHWEKINKCVEAFKDLGQCANDISTLSSYNDADSMTQASGKLNDLSTKLQDVHEKLNGDEIKTVRDEVDKFINKLDKELEKNGMEALESALKPKDSSSTSFSDFLKSYISTLIDRIKTSNGNQEQNKECDIHLRVRNDLQQLSECLKVMCDVCSTGMKDFAEKLKACVGDANDHLDGIKDVKDKLDQLKSELGEIKEASSQDSVKDKVKSAISTIHSLLSNQYIYQTQPIVSTFINKDATEKMTTYLKSLPDLIRDRYVLQKWSDSPEAFCGVQEFKDGIVKGSDITGITGVLKELLKDTYHTDDKQFPITIHDFQVKSLIYNFCHKEAMEQIRSGVRLLYFVSHYVNRDQGTNTSSPELKWEKIKDKHELKRVVDDICGNSYLRYFAGHLRDSTKYYSLRNRGITHPLYPNLANAVMTDNCIRATQ